jgi:hypothetical protein
MLHPCRVQTYFRKKENIQVVLITQSDVLVSKKEKLKGSVVGQTIVWPILSGTSTFYVT